MGKRLLDAEQVGEMLGMSGQAVLRYVREGRIPHVRIGRLVRFDMGRVEAWIASGGSGLNGEPNKEVQ